jgi:hypothetical protein
MPVFPMEPSTKVEIFKLSEMPRWPITTLWSN